MPKHIEQKEMQKDIVHFRKKMVNTKANLLTSDKRLQFIQRQRDEAHRFAISFHKNKKRKRIKRYPFYK